MTIHGITVGKYIFLPSFLVVLSVSEALSASVGATGVVSTQADGVSTALKWLSISTMVTLPACSAAVIMKSYLSVLAEK